MKPRVRPNRPAGTCGWCHEKIFGQYKVVHRSKAPFKHVRTHPECRMEYVRSMEGQSS